MRKLAVKITNSENKEIEFLIEKINSLNSLMETLNENKQYANFMNENINKIKDDYSKTNLEMKKWWDKMLCKYELKEIQGYVYTVVCREEAIYIIDKKQSCCRECS